MTDTQWPTYQVFKQDRADLPHENAGTVHAPDTELALQNARDVFVRRPDCVSLWVVPESGITSRTAEQAGLESEGHAADGPAEAYLVFKKIDQRGSHMHAGSVTAPSPWEAMHAAQAAFPSPRALVWWVVPERLVGRTAEEDSPSLFDGAHHKPYRDQAFYRTDTLMREVRRQAAAAGRRTRGSRR